MIFENNALLSEEQVLLILQEAWSFSSSPHRIKNINDLKLSDWDVLAEDIIILFSSSKYKAYNLPTFSGEAYFKILGKPLTKKSRSIYTVILFILVKKKMIVEEDKSLLINFSNVRNHFLQKYFDSPAINDAVSEDILPKEKIAIDSVPLKVTTSRKYYWLVATFVIGFVGLFALNMKSNLSDTITPEIIIETDDPKLEMKISSNTTNFEPPCDVTFEYDLSKIDYNKAYLNLLDQKILLAQSKGSYTHTFTKPIGTEVSLEVDNQIKKYFVPINSTGWLAYADKYGMPLAIEKGVLHHNINKIPSPILSNGDYYINYANIHDWKIDGDNMTYEARVKNSPEEGGISCFDIAIDINGKYKYKKGVLSFNLLIPGCQRYANLKVGNTSLSGVKGDDLTTSCLNTNEWLMVKVITNNSQVKIYANGQLIHDLPYKGKIGEVKFLQIGFKGSGSVDWVRMKDNTTGERYEENF
jgi:hypothetical protein